MMNDFLFHDHHPLAVIPTLSKTKFSVEFQMATCYQETVLQKLPSSQEALWHVLEQDHTVYETLNDESTLITK